MARPCLRRFCSPSVFSSAQRVAQSQQARSRSPQLRFSWPFASQIPARPPRRRRHSAMVMVSSAKRRRVVEEEQEEDEDRISRLPDGILGDIVTLLPINDGARTQVLSSRWRHIWRSAPLNINLDPNRRSPLGANNVTESVISRILSAHQGPSRRFSIPEQYLYYKSLPATSLDGWLESPALDRLQELEFHYGRPYSRNLAPPPQLPASVHRFSSTLRAVHFGGCCFRDGNNASGLHFPVLKQLSLSDVIFSESSLRALLAACPILQSLLLKGSIGLSRVQIASPTLRSISLHSNQYGHVSLQQLIVEDAPCLERLLCFHCLGITISVISAPKLLVLGPLSDQSPKLEFGTAVTQGGSGFVSLNMVVHSVKVLLLYEEHLSLDVVSEFMKCFPYLERLYIETRRAGGKNVWCHKYRNLIGTLDIRLRKIVLAGYRGNTSHVNFAKFFVLNARMLESMRLESYVAPNDSSNAWIDKQHRLLQTKNKASRDMQLDLGLVMASV